jgi:arginase
MNADKVAIVVRAVAEGVVDSLGKGRPVLVLGGDCTVELGTVAGALQQSESVGLVYIDLDTDLNTPSSTNDGALDWMGVAHMLNIDGTLPELARIGPRVPLLRGEQILFFADDNSKPFEREIIQGRGITEVRLVVVVADPAGSARSVVAGWARRFERLPIHVDLDALDYLDMPLAENYRRNRGLRFEELMAALSCFLEAPNWAALTLTELNPDHGEDDGSLRYFVDRLTCVLSTAPRIRGARRQDLQEADQKESQSDG